MNQTVASAFPAADLTLARLAPRGTRAASGLRAPFADLPRLLEHLGRGGFDGYAALLDEAGRAAAVGVLFEGRIVNAASTTDAATLWGQSALADLQRRYAAGLPLDLHELERPVAHALSGVAERLFHAQPADNFSGVQVRGDGDAVLLGAGRPLVVVAAGLSEPGTFPAPLRPPTLTLPGPVGAAAGARYSLTLRGRDAVNPITDVYQRVRSQHGREGIDLLQQLARGLAPTDAAGLNGQDLPAVEKVVEAFLREGLLRREP